MKIYVARHAETNYNLKDLCNGDPTVNVYLTPKGIEQGKLLAKSLENIPIDIIFTSQFPRTKETANLVNKYHDVPLVEDARLGDVVTGFEGKSVEEYRAARRQAKNQWTARFNDGESFEDIRTRVTSFMDDLKTREEKSVLIITHQIIARLIYAIYKQLPNDEADKLEISNTHCFELDI